MIASGGFGQNQDMREEYLPKPTNKDWGCEPSTNTGEPIKAAEAIGAKLKFMDKAWWVTTVKAPDEDFPRLSEVEKSLPGNYTVNKSGLRFANESQNYLTFMLEVLKKEKEGDLIIFTICGLICGIAALCISGASKILESSIFAPIQYVQLVSGFIFGYIFFKDLPDIYEILGSIVIISSGLFIIYRQNKLGIKSFVKDQLSE